jgi:hypothetical protein
VPRSRHGIGDQSEPLAFGILEVEGLPAVALRDLADRHAGAGKMRVPP